MATGSRRALVSVVVPCYGYAELLPGCVESVLAQQDVDVRVLVVDDCSPDDTEAVGQALAAGDRRAEYRRHAENRGLIATANTGLDWADGDCVVVLSADDFLVPGALARAAAVLDANPRVGMVYGAAPYLRPGHGPPGISSRWRGTDVWRGADWIRMRCRSGHNCISSPEVVVRAATQRRVGLYDAACTHASDLNMWLRIAAAADIAYIRGAAQALYRVHPTSMLRTAVGGDPLVDLRERWIAFDAFFSAASDLEEHDRLRDLAGRALAGQALWRASRTVDRGLAAPADGALVEALVAFATEVHPAVAALPQWRGLQLRRRIGPGRSGWFPPFLATGAAHRLRGHVDTARWARTGV